MKVCKTKVVTHWLAHLKQMSVVRHVAQLRHIILIPCHPIFALIPKCWRLSREDLSYS